MRVSRRLVLSVVLSIAIFTVPVAAAGETIFEKLNRSKTAAVRTVQVVRARPVYYANLNNWHTKFCLLGNGQDPCLPQPGPPA